MKTPIRYGRNGGDLEPLKDGQFVAWSDYAELKGKMSDTKYHQALSANRKLVKEIDRLKAENERLRSASFVTAVPSEEYERLRKVGDAMYDAVVQDSMGLWVMPPFEQWSKFKKELDDKNEKNINQI